METLKTLDLPADQGYKWYYDYLITFYKKLTFNQINELVDIILKESMIEHSNLCWSIPEKIDAGGTVVVRMMEDIIIQADLEGFYCYLLTKNVKGTSITRFGDSMFV